MRDILAFVRAKFLAMCELMVASQMGPPPLRPRRSRPTRDISSRLRKGRWPGTAGKIRP